MKILFMIHIMLIFKSPCMAFMFIQNSLNLLILGDVVFIGVTFAGLILLAE